MQCMITRMSSTYMHSAMRFPSSSKVVGKMWTAPCIPDSPGNRGTAKDKIPKANHRRFVWVITGLTRPWDISFLKAADLQLLLFTTRFWGLCGSHNGAYQKFQAFISTCNNQMCTFCLSWQQKPPDEVMMKGHYYSLRVSSARVQAVRESWELELSSLPVIFGASSGHRTLCMNRANPKEKTTKESTPPWMPLTCSHPTQTSAV